MVGDILTQWKHCCCCFVCVLAAMFGIFILSIGVSVIANVTYMEVNTSGLPSGLQNDKGKKIVGISLICVALAFLGLSATVSVLYFSRGNKQAQQRHHPQRITEVLNMRVLSKKQKPTKRRPYTDTSGRPIPRFYHFKRRGLNKIHPIPSDHTQKHVNNPECSRNSKNNHLSSKKTKNVQFKS